MYEDEFGCPSVGADDEECAFPGECCIPWPHTRNECVTAEMMEAYEKEMAMENNEGMTRCPTCGRTGDDAEVIRVWLTTKDGKTINECSTEYGVYWIDCEGHVRNAIPEMVAFEPDLVDAETNSWERGTCVSFSDCYSSREAALADVGKVR